MPITINNPAGRPSVGYNTISALQALVGAIGAVQEQGRQRQLQALQLLSRQPGTQIEPVSPDALQGQSFLDRLLGAQPRSATGEPVYNLGGGLTLKLGKVPTYTEQDFALPPAGPSAAPSGPISGPITQTPGRVTPVAPGADITAPPGQAPTSGAGAGGLGPDYSAYPVEVRRKLLQMGRLYFKGDLPDEALESTLATLITPEHATTLAQHLRAIRPPGQGGATRLPLVAGPGAPGATASRNTPARLAQAQAERLTRQDPALAFAPQGPTITPPAGAGGVALPPAEERSPAQVAPSPPSAPTQTSRALERAPAGDMVEVPSYGTFPRRDVERINRLLAPAFVGSPKDKTTRLKRIQLERQLYADLKTEQRELLKLKREIVEKNPELREAVRGVTSFAALEELAFAGDTPAMKGAAASAALIEAAKAVRTADGDYDQAGLAHIYDTAARYLDAGAPKATIDLRLKGLGVPLAEEGLKQGTLLRQKGAMEQQFRLEQTLQDVAKDDAERFFDVQTGQVVNSATPYAEVLQQQRGGQVTRVSKTQQEKLETLQATLPVLQRLNEYYQAIYGPGGVYASMRADDRQTWEGLLRQGTQISDQLAQRYPVLLAAQRYANSNLEAIARGLKAVKGAGTEGDIERVLEGLPRLLSTFGLKGYLPDVSLPDSRAVALRVWDDLVSTVNKSTGVLLGNPRFQWRALPPALARPEFSGQGPASPRASAPASAPLPATPTGPRVPFARELQRLTPEQFSVVSEEYLVGVRSPADVPGLSMDQKRALLQRLRQRQR